MKGRHRESDFQGEGLQVLGLEIYWIVFSLFAWTNSSPVVPDDWYRSGSCLMWKEERAQRRK